MSTQIEVLKANALQPAIDALTASVNTAKTQTEAARDASQLARDQSQAARDSAQSASSAAQSASVVAQASQVGAEAAAASAAAFAATSEWVSGESYVPGDLVWSPATGETFRALATHTGVTTDPSEDATNWIAVLRQGVLYLDGGTMTGPLALKSVSGTLAEPSAGVIDLSAGTAFSIALGGAVDFSLTNVPAGPWSVTLRLSASGAQAPVYPATWLWADPGKPADLDDGETLVITLRGDGGQDGFVYAAVQWRGDTSLSGLFFATSLDGAALKMHDHGPAGRLFTDAGTTPAPFGDRVRQITGLTPPGRNATQATEASRPRACRQPVGGVRNLLTYSEQLDNADWVTLGTVVVGPNQAIAPDGTLSADRVTTDDLGSTNLIAQILNSITQNGTYTLSIYFKAVTPGINDTFRLNLRATGGTIEETQQTYTASSEWQRGTLTINVGDNTTLVARPMRDGAGITDIYIWGAQLEEDDTATAYQKVTSQYDVFEAGQRHVYGVEWNGATESLVVGPFAEGFTGDVAFVTPSGIWIEESVTVASAGNLTLGPVNGPGGTADFFVDYPRSVAVIPLENGFTAADIARLQAFAAGLGLPNTILSGA